MTAKSETVLASSLIGVFGGLLVALAVMPLIPVLSREPLPGRVSWGIALASPIGLFVGGALGAVLYRRAKRVDYLERLLVEVSGIAVVVVGVVIQFVLPFRWPLPRLTITAVACVVAGLVTGVCAFALKPLYWQCNRKTNVS